MGTGVHPPECKLTLTLPQNLATGVITNVHSKLTFNVTLSVKNIDTCLLSLRYDKGFFEEEPKDIEVTFTQEIGEKDVAFTLTPISQTTRPTWVEITATAGTLIQTGGFFVTVTRLSTR